MRILTAEEMREVDRRAIEELGIPGLVLMENAAIGVADAVGERFPEAGDVAIVCGPGNNRGDGLAITRHLAGRGYGVRVFLLQGRRGLRGDAAVQLEILRRSGMTVKEVGPESDLHAVAGACGGCDLLIDALFGTGLSRPLEGRAAELVAALDRQRIPRLAVDLASGLDGSQSEISGPFLRADVTVTFAAPKVAHIFPPAAEAAGELVVADLGLPPGHVERAPGDLHLLVEEELGMAPPRLAASHKGDFGHALLVAGAPGTAGAAILAARAAVRGGAGLVTVAVPAPIQPVVDGGSLESMTLALEAGTDGGLAGGAARALLAALAGKQALAVGPGLGQDPGTAAAVRELCAAAPRPLVLDAEGLNAFAGRLEELKGRPEETILTPHPGEMGRLLGMSAADVQRDRISAVRQAARASGSVVVLKGYQTLVAAADGDAVYVNPTGNPGMASGGSGDVLTGLLVALIAQGDGALAAACLGVFVHGLAGDLAVAEVGEQALRAGDLIAALPRAFLRLTRAGRAG